MLSKGLLIKHDMIDMGIQFCEINTQAGGCVRLRIKVDDEGAFTQQGKGRAKVYGRCCLAHATLLIGDAYYFMRHNGGLP